MYVCMYVCMYGCVSVNVGVDVSTYVCTYVRKYVCEYVRKLSGSKEKTGESCSAELSGRAGIPSGACVRHNKLASGDYVGDQLD
jgi:hypothetical protein